MKLRFLIKVLVAMAVSVQAVHAEVSCSKNVTSVIVHTDGNIYFQTDQTCAAAWCQLSLSTDSANKSAYAMLLTARATGKPLSFEWPNISACTTQNAVYASPGYITFNG